VQNIVSKTGFPMGVDARKTDFGKAVVLSLAEQSIVEIKKK